MVGNPSNQQYCADFFVTSLIGDASSHGVKTHANLFGALIQNDLVTQASNWQIYAFGFVALLLVLLGLLVLSPAGEMVLILSVIS